MLQILIGQFKKRIGFPLLNGLAEFLRFVTFPARNARTKKYFSRKTPPENILITFFGRGFGDCIYFSGVLKTLRDFFPQSRIRLAIYSRLEKYFDKIPYVDEIIPCPDYFGAGRKGLDSFFQSAKQAAREGTVDLFLDLCPTLNVMPALWSSFIPKSFSAGTGGLLKKIFYDQFSEINWSKHYFETITDGLAVVGIKIDHASFWVPKEDPLNGLLPPGNESLKAVIIAPGGRRTVEAPKDYCWTFQGFFDLIPELTSRGYSVILTGAEYDRPYLTSVKPHRNLIDLVGKTTFPQLFTLVKKHARLVVCNNSGLLHVASVQNIPTVSYADPQENMLRWYPYPPSEKHIFLQDTGSKKVSSQEFLEVILERLAETRTAEREEKSLPATSHRK